VGRKAIAEAVVRRLGAAGVAGVQLMAGAEPHSLESVYRRLVQVFFGVAWFQPDEAVLRVEAARADLRALIVITDCDLQPADLGRLLGTFPQCRFLLTSRQRTLEHDAGAAYEVDPLTPGQARELITRVLGSNPAGLQNLQAEEAWRLADGHVLRLLQHAAFLDRTASRPGATASLPVPLQQQVAILVAGLSEPARRVLIALSTFSLALDPSVFSAVTGLPAAAHSADELLSAGLISPYGAAYQISPDAAVVLARAGERTDPQVAADGLTALRDAPDPHLLLAVARALRAAGHDARASRIARAGAPLALARGEVEVWIQMVALGTQSAMTARRKPDLEYFLNEQHTDSLLRGDTVAAAAALAALAALLSDHQATPTAVHTGTRAPRAVRRTRRALSAGHGAGAAGAAVAAAALIAVIVVAIQPTAQTSAQLTGKWAQQGGYVYDFAETSPGSYTADPAGANAQCQVANDIKVKGSNGHYKGSMDMYSGCRTVIGTGTITINVAANGQTARVTTSGSGCSNCGVGTWTRVDAAQSSSPSAAPSGSQDASGSPYSTSPSAAAATASALDVSVGEYFTSKMGAKATAKCGPEYVSNRFWECYLTIPPNSGSSFINGGGPQGSVDIEITGPHTWQQTS
jgi:hypothetical protein